MDRELPPGSLGGSGAGAVARARRKHQPGVLAFTSLTAGRSYLRRPAGFGEQRETVGAMRVWPLPSPSPAANGTGARTSAGRELAERARAVR